MLGGAGSGRIAAGPKPGLDERTRSPPPLAWPARTNPDRGTDARAANRLGVLCPGAFLPAEWRTGRGRGLSRAGCPNAAGRIVAQFLPRAMLLSPTSLSGGGAVLQRMYRSLAASAGL